jgi:SAM-dependent methyltransferase
MINDFNHCLENILKASGYDGYQKYNKDLVPDGATKKKWDILEPYLEDIKDKKILDLGGNMGFFSFKTDSLGANTTYVDNNHRLSAYCKLFSKSIKSNVNFLTGDAVKICNQMDEQFDYIIMLASYMHICRTEKNTSDDEIKYNFNCEPTLNAVRKRCRGKIFLEFTEEYSKINHTYGPEWCIANFEKDIGRHFSEFKVIGKSTHTRPIYLIEA